MFFEGFEGFPFLFSCVLTGGKCKVWGSDPVYITAQYEIVDRTTGKITNKSSLLLASGFWGVARHFQYFFELIAAWVWCLLANPLQVRTCQVPQTFQKNTLSIVNMTMLLPCAQNGALPLFYAAFLTGLLIDRANRDSKKCHLKYGKHYEAYCKLVPYKILPGIY